MEASWCDEGAPPPLPQKHYMPIEEKLRLHANKESVQSVVSKCNDRQNWLSPPQTPTKKNNRTKQAICFNWAGGGGLHGGWGGLSPMKKAAEGVGKRGSDVRSMKGQAGTSDGDGSTGNAPSPPLHYIPDPGGGGAGRS